MKEVEGIPAGSNLPEPLSVFPQSSRSVPWDPPFPCPLRATSLNLPPRPGAQSSCFLCEAPEQTPPHRAI